uniref:Uncharacterized protein n=1 Tax=Arundo donax TaxID=35708 RepID=A0A0A9APX3_ARUDO
MMIKKRRAWKSLMMTTRTTIVLIMMVLIRLSCATTQTSFAYCAVGHQYILVCYTDVCSLLGTQTMLVLRTSATRCLVIIL